VIEEIGNKQKNAEKSAKVKIVTKSSASSEIRLDSLQKGQAAKPIKNRRSNGKL
jgi:hypothetical protein